MAKATRQKLRGGGERGGLRAAAFVDVEKALLGSGTRALPCRV